MQETDGLISFLMDYRFERQALFTVLKVKENSIPFGK